MIKNILKLFSIDRTQVEIKLDANSYPVWRQFEEKQNMFIGGVLEDFGDTLVRQNGATSMQTKILGIKLEANGKDSAFFSVIGENFSCGFDVSVGEISDVDKEWITFRGVLEHIWRIKKPI
jgi:hypothetical protein